MDKRMNKEELINLIESLKIDKDEYWILSSGALVIRGVYPDAGDLDIAVTEKGLEELKSNYNLKEKENGWYIVNDKVECVLETKETWKIEKFGKYNLQTKNFLDPYSMQLLLQMHISNYHYHTYHPHS